VPAVLQQDIITVTKPLADVVYQKTNGKSISYTALPENVTRGTFYLSLASHDEMRLWKLERIRSETEMGNTVVELIAKMVDRLPHSIKDVLKIAAAHVLI